MKRSDLHYSPLLLITGTRKGIGYFLANYYCERGFQVIGCSRQPAEIGYQNYQHFCIDIVDERQVKNMFSCIRKTYGQLDILINNVGINPLISLSLMTPVEFVTRAINVNFVGTFLMSREAVKLMKKNSFGRIINFGSMAVKHEVEGEAVYTASKAAVVAFSRVLAKEIYSLGITCNVVSPSAIKTDLMAAADNDALRDVLKRNAVNNFGKMEDISNIINWLIKPESCAITGQVIYQGGV